MRWTIKTVGLMWGVVVLMSGTASGQAKDTALAFPWEGEVSGANVFVRSGAGNNWYPTTKLNAGDRVLVLGEKFGWYQIAPPPGSFSYIDMGMVDRKAGAKTGTVKQDKVYVRAGSKLETRKSSTQVVLNKGAAVEITGEADGFYQIKPPNGATLFISKQYVKSVDAAMRTGLIEKHVTNKEPIAEPAAPDATTGQTASAQQPGGNTQPSIPQPTTMAAAEPGRTLLPNEPEATPTDATGNEQSPIDSASPADQPKDGTTSAKKPSKPKDTKAQLARKNEPASTPPPTIGRYKAMLTVAEGDLTEMMRRPFDDRDFASLIQKYEPIARQTEESVPAQIAQIRLRQLQNRTQLRLARSENDKDTRELQDLRANMDQERIKIMNRRVDAAMVRYDLEGELRESFAFAPENRRFRLVDPRTKVTTAYVDIPATVEGNPRHLIGQLVGIKTAGSKFSTSARVPIAVAAEVVDLSPRKKMGDGTVEPVTMPLENNPPEGDKSIPNAAAEKTVPAPEPAADAGDEAQP